MQPKSETQETEDLYDLLAALCALPAPTGKEERRAAFCCRWLTENGVPHATVDAVGNVVVVWDGEDDRPLTVIAAHTDTVFPETEPPVCREDDGRLYCPGVGDNTGSVAVLMMTLRALAREGFRPRGGLLAVLNVGEEGLGNLRGIRHLMDTYAGRVMRCISLDSMSMAGMADTCVGSHRYRVTVTTPGGHSFAAFGAPNALAVLAGLIEQIYALPVPPIPGSHTTYNVGTVSGGTSVNTIAQDAEMLCEYRSDNVEALALMEAAFARIFSAPQAEGVTVTAERIGDRPCAVGVSPAAQESLAVLCSEAIRSVTGVAPRRHPSSTDCNIPLSRGIPAVCIGVLEGSGAHTRGEWIRKDSLITGMQVLRRVIDRLEETN